jgi:DNA repair exonuclease SbcCD ATPase subunit
MIYLKTLKWDNCFSYGKGNSINFDDSAVTQLIGTNGTGKSSIPLILEEVLYGKNNKGIKKQDIPNRYLEEGYHIELKFKVDKDKYEIVLNRKSSISLKISKNGTDISSHTTTATYKTIENILGLNYKTFSQLFYQSASSNLEFLKATDTNRKKFLIALLGLDKYIELFELFKDKHKEYNSSLVAIEASCSVIDNWLAENALEDTTPMNILEVPEDAAKEVEEYTKLKGEYDNAEQINKDINKNNEYMRMLKNVDIDEVVKQVDKPESVDSEVQEKGSLTSQSAAKKALITKLSKLDSQCPMCMQSVDEEFITDLISKAKEVISSNTVRIEEVEDIITSAKAELLAYHTHQKVVADFENLNNLVDSTKSTKLVDRDNAQTKMIVLKEAIQQVRKNIKKAIAHNEKATAFNTKIDVILEQTADFEEKLRIKTAELEELRELAAIVDILKKSFSTNGLIAYKIESLVKDLEDEINKYLAELSAGRFQLNFNLKGEKLNIQIIDEGRIVEIEALSSGEFGRVNTATLLGIRKVMNILSKSKLNLLILDEVMGVLDDSGKEKLVEILLEETEINTFIVSHEYTHPLLNKINITKENNISRLENG